MLNLCIFISGRGSNFAAIIKAIKEKKLKAKITCLITNNPKAKGLLIAKKNNIPTFIANYGLGKNFAEQEILNYLRKKEVNLIVLVGFMKILSSNFIENYPNKIINIHPSLLPKYKGLNTHEKVLKNKDKFHGATVHFVTKELDAGEIIVQEKVEITKNITLDNLKAEVLKIEHKIIVVAISKFC